MLISCTSWRKCDTYGCDFFSPNKHAEEQSGTDVLGWHLLVFYLRSFIAALHLQMRKYKKGLSTLD
jgi:hypothetical protein